MKRKYQPERVVNFEMVSPYKREKLDMPNNMWVYTNFNLKRKFQSVFYN
jgi:predicted O-linked N-acetylglucosamine transferase (SPINDLY family)